MALSFSFSNARIRPHKEHHSHTPVTMDFGESTVSAPARGLRASFGKSAAHFDAFRPVARTQLSS